MDEPRDDEVIERLLGPQSSRERGTEMRWLDATTHALLAPRHRPRVPAMVVLAAAAVLLFVLISRFTPPPLRGPASMPCVELDVSGAVRAIADGRACDPSRVRFCERVELESETAIAGRMASGDESVWWRGRLVLITDQDRAARAEEENHMPRTKFRIGPWSLTVLVGTLSWIDPMSTAAAAEPVAARTPLPPVVMAPAVVDAQIVVRGRVLDPAGTPMRDASVYVVPSHYSKTPVTAIASVRSDAEGRFTIAFDPSACDYFENSRTEPWRDAKIVATAAGFGPAWITCRDLKGSEATLRLVADLPVEGRVVDLEARPVAGARVRVAALMAPESGDLTEHLKAFSLGERPWRSTSLRLTQVSSAMLPSASATTDAEGRFTIPGLGSERMLTLEISGETIALTRASVVTRVMEPLTYDRRGNLSLPELDRIWGARPEIAVQPTQPIEGVVRDAATGEPLGGVTIESYQWANINWVDVYRLSTTSGSDGRYRLVGMPKATSATLMINGNPMFGGNSLRVLPNDEQPYLMREVEVPQAPGLATIKLDLELHRGLWIEGSVTDKETGEPVRARVFYFPFRSNPHAQRLPEFPPNRSGAHGAQDRYHTREDGTFRIPGLPGRAIVGAQCFRQQYREGAGSEHIEGLDKGGSFPVWGYTIPAGKLHPTTMVEINPPEGATVVTCELEADPGPSVHVKLVDEDDQPISGCTVRNASRAWSPDPLQSAELHVVALAPDEKRAVFIHHAARNVGQVIRVSPGPDSITVKLEACASIKGRLLDHLGDPVSGAMITMHLNPSGDWMPTAASAGSDADGRFAISSVLPGSDYALQVDESRVGFQGIRDKLSIKPGETIDLGDVRLKERE